MTIFEIAAHVLVVAVPGLTLLAYDRTLEH